MNEFGTLILAMSNETNNYLNGTGDDSIGKSLYEVYGTPNANSRHAYFHKWKNLRQPFSYIYERNGESWVATIEVTSDEINGIVRKANPTDMGENESNDFSLFEDISEDSSNTVSLLLRLTGNSFELESSNELLTILAHEYGSDGKDMSIVDEHQVNNLLNCVKRNKQIKRIIGIDGFNIVDSKHYYLVNAIPILHTDITGVLIRATDITSEYCARVPRKPSQDMNYEYLMNSSLFGICTLNINENNITLGGYNNYFKRLINENVITLPELRNCKAVQDCIESIQINSGHIVKSNSQGISIEYLVNGVPVLHDEKLERILIFISPQEESFEKYAQLKSKLTQRELEILTFVADGFTNRYIAKKLEISEGTVKRTIYNAYKKLEIGSRVELVRIFFNL
ncbi:MAG: LuxR C-terminal-related transcriptional regulator [Oscillospiraceae bacterium]